MADIFTKKKRSEVMARIRSRGNRDTELRLVTLLRAHGITGWRRHVRLRAATGGKRGSAKAPDPLSVRPDFVFRRERVAVFVDGCFWHGCAEHCRVPATRRRFWEAKIARNRERDRLVTRLLRKAGWRVLRVWEHALTARESARTLTRIRKAVGAEESARGES